jgi:RNA polymerase sigma factor (sigma-70 family)
MDSRLLHSLLLRLRRSAEPPDGGLSDAELLRRFVRRRDEAAFELLVWRHGPMVLGVCRRVLSDAHGAEDAFQATFLALVRKAGSIAGGGAVAPWLYRVALRVALRARAAAARRAPRPGLPVDLPAPEADSPVERDWQPILDEEIDRLPERYRRPVVLCHLQGCTLAEAARQLGCPRGTVAVRLVRARQRLRLRLTRRGVVLTAALSVALAGGRTAPAALVKATVRSALGYALDGAASALPAPVLTLTEGVLRAMFLSKLKFATTALLATALVGAGAGWATYQAVAGEAPGGDPVAQAGAPQRETPPSKAESGRRAEDQKAVEERRRQEHREELRDRLRLMEDKLRESEKQVAAQEEQWLEELIQARLKVTNLQEELSTRQREAAELSEPPDRQADPRIRTLSYEHNALAAKLEEIKRVGGRDGPLAEQTSKQLAELQAQVRAREEDLDKESALKKAARDKVLTEMRGLRRELLVAEEKLRALRRRQEWQQAEARRDLEERSQRLRQLRQAFEDANAGLPPAAREPADLERKLDEVLRELGELRRTLRRPANDP